LIQTEELLLAESDPDTGQPVIQSVSRAEELYRGPWIELAPDLLCEPAPGYSFARGASGHLQRYEWYMGDHDKDGIFVASGPGLRQSVEIENANLIDIAPTVLFLANVPIPKDMDGMVLDLFEDNRLVASPPRYEQESEAYEGSSHTFSPEEERVIEEHLRSLGYL
jgi:predicted AlkP superfamily phosphohydrolase/phosphomutase